jgi:hypothetical protein
VIIKKNKKTDQESKRDKENLMEKRIKGSKRI